MLGSRFWLWWKAHVLRTQKINSLFCRAELRLGPRLLCLCYTSASIWLLPKCIKPHVEYFCWKIFVFSKSSSTGFWELIPWPGVSRLWSELPLHNTTHRKTEMCMFPVLGHPAAVILCVAGAGIMGAPASSCSDALLWVLLHFYGFCCPSLGSAALLWVLSGGIWHLRRTAWTVVDESSAELCTKSYNINARKRLKETL